MSFDLETNTPEEQETFAHRYKEIDAANARSFYMNNPNRSFDVFQSVHSFGEPRVDLSAQPENTDVAALAARRVVAGGNMSNLGTYGPPEMTPEERIEDANTNMHNFLESIEVPEVSVYMLNPERDYSTPLTVVDVDAQETQETDAWPRRLDNSGDFLYTRDRKKVLGVRPADCPVMIASADTPEGKLYMMVHYAWKGAANQYVKQTADIFDSLGVDRDSLEVYLTPGGQAESFPYTNYPQDPRKEFPGTDGLFAKVREHEKEDGTKVWDFGIDTPKFVYDQVIEQFGIDPKQVFCDTSDTSALESGASSHGRSMRLQKQGEANARDFVTAVFN